MSFEVRQPQGEVQAWLAQNWARRMASDCDGPVQAILANIPEEDRPAVQLSLQRAALVSSIFADALRRGEALIRRFNASAWCTRLSAQAIRAALAEQVDAADDEAALMKVLRVSRREHMERWHWLHANGLVGMADLTRELSDFADTCVDLALAKATAWHEAKYGTPVSPSGETQRLAVYGMGKLGARELNLSSDIDLIFVYPENGETAVAPGSESTQRSIPNQQFFIRVGQQLIRLLDAKTADGFVFRVDMRLRPYGSAGALAWSFIAMESYYEEQGREWERYALIKARTIAGDMAAGDALLETLRPFIYRRYVDFSVIESLRDMKALINREVKRKGMESNIKTGEGGIREAEFIAQAFQLIRGGRDTRLQLRSLLRVYDVLAELNLLESDVCAALVRDYIFLRDCEHAIQCLEDHQSQVLPDGEDNWFRLALCLGFATIPALQEAIAESRRGIRRHFSNVISDTPAEAQEEQGAEGWRNWWQSLCDATDEFDVALREPLLVAGLPAVDADAVMERLVHFVHSRAVRALKDVPGKRLQQVMPHLFAAIERQQVMRRDVLLSLLELLEKIIRRSAYLVLLQENPQARHNLVYLLANSSWAAERIIFSPILLDELLDATQLYTPPDLDTLQHELRQQLTRIPEDDMESQMECLRHFKQAHALRVAASELVGSLPLMKVSDYLTFLASTILQEVLNMAWAQMVDKYGRPCGHNGEACETAFCIVGYGKLGGIELSYNSDLDLVFLYDAPPSGVTDGENSLANETFYIRLAQRIIHILSTRTFSGELYEVDSRLRPSGASGLLVSTVQAFATYQLEKAWTWEHQALVRARPVAGCPVTADRFREVREQVLGQQREPEKLRADVMEMRDKMVSHLGSKEPGIFDLKQDRGGIVDIEFMVQYAVLRWAHDYPALLRYTDNIRILERLAASGLIADSEAESLKSAYLGYRSMTHSLALQNRKATVDDQRFVAEREQVSGFWRRIVESEAH